MTGGAARATATHTPPPTGAVGSAPCQPAPVPRANAITTTPPSATSLAAVTTFCTHRPEATPTRLIPVNRATSPAPSGAMSAGGQPARRTRNSPPATPIAAIATPLVPKASTQPTTNPARGPNASRTKAYLPAALGCRVVSSAKHSAPRNASAAPKTQTTNVSPGLPSRAATMPGVRKIPAPTGRPPPPPPPPHPPPPPPRGTGAPAVTIVSAATPLGNSAPTVTVVSPAPTAPLGLARRRRRTVAPVARVAAITPLTTIARIATITHVAATLHRIALAYRRRVGAPPRNERSFGGPEPRSVATISRVGTGAVLEVHLPATAVGHAPPVDGTVVCTVSVVVPEPAAV